MREPKNKEIDGLNVTVQPWPARVAWRRQVSLGKVFGPALKSLGSAFETGDFDNVKDSDVNLGKIGEAFAHLFEGLSEQTADEVLVMCLKGARVNNVEVTAETIDAQFDTIPQLYKTVAFVLEVNFGGFLGKSGIGRLLAK